MSAQQGFLRIKHVLESFIALVHTILWLGVMVLLGIGLHQNQGKIGWEVLLPFSLYFPYIAYGVGVWVVTWVLNWIVEGFAA